MLDKEKKLINEFKLYCYLTNRNPRVELYNIVNDFLSQYRNKDGEFDPKAGMYNDGEKKSRCIIFGKTTIADAPFVLISVDGTVMTVPENSVEELDESVL